MWMEPSTMIPISNGHDEIKGNESCFNTSVLYPDVPVAITSLGQSRLLQDKRRKWHRKIEKHKFWLNCKRHPTKSPSLCHISKEDALKEIDAY